MPDERLLLGESVAVELDPNHGIGAYQNVILSALWDDPSEYDRNLFYKAYMTALRAAMNLGVKSIVVPAMGYDGNLPVSGAAFLRVIQELDALTNSREFSLRDIYVVSPNSNHISYLRSHVEGMIYR